MIKLKLGEIRVLIEPLKKLSVQEFPVKYSWKIMDLCEKVEVCVNKVEKLRVQLIEKYGEDLIICKELESDKEVFFREGTEVDETQYSILGTRKEVRDTNKLQMFYAEFNELLAEEVELIQDKIDLSAIVDNITASAQELSILKSVFIFE